MDCGEGRGWPCSGTKGVTVFFVIFWLRCLVFFFFFFFFWLRRGEGGFWNLLEDEESGFV
jgi:uncharacterized membrane protein